MIIIDYFVIFQEIFFAWEGLLHELLSDACHKSATNHMRTVLSGTNLVDVNTIVIFAF